MRLSEYQGKMLFRRHGLAVPKGRLVGDPAAADLPFPVVAKVQSLDGGRGKRGGVRVVPDADTLASTVLEWRAGSPALPPARDILLEEYLDIQRELYLSIGVDRDERTPVLLAHPTGGVDVEAMEPGSFLRQHLSLPQGPTAEQIEDIATWLGLEGTAAEECHRAVASLWQVYCREECTLVEVNPLVVCADDRLVAADARVAVDDAARSRHPDWPQNVEGSAFERAVAAAGAVGTQLDGDTAVVTSGAGLGMATLDLLTARGVAPACLIDLGGAVFRGAEAMADVLTCVSLLRPGALFLNVFLQIGPCDDVARAFLSVADDLRGIDVVMRLKGRNADIAAGILKECDVILVDDLALAVEAMASTDAGGRVVSEPWRANHRYPHGETPPRGGVSPVSEPWRANHRYPHGETPPRGGVSP